MGANQVVSQSSGTASVNLDGRLILYVGGRHQHVAGLRELVEECNGTFAHHDGGVEQSMEKLGGLLKRADAVMFPVRCVSHKAQFKVKSACRKSGKPFRPLRSMGAEAVIQALQAMV
ncbi:MAG TPA: DUF2325 domain-containing protein [Rhodospirillaceae bacterium]|nr:DUF2325 domain-containing protein [Rhodospirillaceae bacterium]